MLITKTMITREYWDTDTRHTLNLAYVSDKYSGFDFGIDTYVSTFNGRNLLDYGINPVFYEDEDGTYKYNINTFGSSAMDEETAKSLVDIMSFLVTHREDITEDANKIAQLLKDSPELKSED